MHNFQLVYYILLKIVHLVSLKFSKHSFNARKWIVYNDSECIQDKRRHKHIICLDG
jgi:hypothetical protein